jgi:hypothetical protein
MNDLSRAATEVTPNCTNSGSGIKAIGGTMPFNGVILFEDEPERECWHEAGHAVVAHHLGMTVLAIGFSWVRGEDSAPNPSCWIPNDGFDKDSKATEFFAGVASEIVRLGKRTPKAASTRV